MSATTLRQRLAQPEILIAPGVYDALGAAIAENVGFEAVFVSGSALAAAHLGRPDIGLLSLPETAEILARIADRVDIPLFVDADQGGGNAYAVARHVRMLERAGASGIQIEDQREVKPASDPLSRPLITTEDMVGKIKAAKDACHSDTVISARSDAVSSEGADAAIDRALAYAAAGADMVFVESLTKRADMEGLIAAVDGKVPVLHNLLRPTDEVRDAATLQQLGYSVALFPAPALRAAGDGVAAALSDLRQNSVVSDSGTAPDHIGAMDFLRQQ